ncbi:hypothetical protein G7K_6778-t1 [Saitoella complicata NRRL Y-17804]|uniref:Transposase Tc1-like domain-containing protein n=1 Tax=Saitoella complicata (strain BCRC 22490 / CBS 7301 / JCM 7358 / NBRC 10748 / NRRL Y-17804) TaxID=698492 RepID=A0A0E9NS41_SAICN|nr:hypothetical protein G7K_6778-t1 [Saitoella complicata NRRL Y-17804]
MPELNMEDIPYSELSHEERPYRCAQIVALTKAEIPKEKIDPRSGRPQILSKRDKDELACGVRTGKYNNAMKAAAAFNHGPQRDVSAETVHLLLLKSGANCVTQTSDVPLAGRRKPFLLPAARERRYQWAKEHLHWRKEDWMRIIYTDESKFQRSGPRHVAKVYVWPGDPPRENEFIPRMHSVGGSIFVFGGMCWWGATKLARSQVPTVDKFVMHDFVEDFLLPKLREFREADINLTIQHDNDAKLHAPNWEEFYEREGYRVLPWPAYSPDMNPIEDS